MIAYYVYERRTQKESVWGAWTQIAFTPDLTYIDTVPAEGTQVQYRAKAVDDQGDEGPYVTGPTKAIDYNNPPVISGEDIKRRVQHGGGRGGAYGQLRAALVRQGAYAAGDDNHDHGIRGNHFHAHAGRVPRAFWRARLFA